jgi:outer membrane receptor protein involved in Fe transport
MKRLLLFALGPVLCFTVLPAVLAEEAEEGQYIEEIIVQGERGEVNVLDRAMTVTGFNQQMIEQLGIQNEQDLEVLVPGLQIGNRSQGGGKMEDDHYYMRGLGSERSVNFFSDTSVAVYIDGVWTDQTYGSDGMFDVERVEVARGPQGTTGGRAAIGGSISFHTRKPTDVFDVRAEAEFTDQTTQRMRVAFGGPISDSGFSYRLGLGRWTGDGTIDNIGFGPDVGEPDQTIFAPQLRWKNDRWDITARYSRQTDRGTPHSSLPLGSVNTVDQYILNDATGECLTVTDPVTGESVCQRNPFFGNPANPATEKCSNINSDGTRDELNIICDPDDMQWEVAFNAPLEQDNEAENASLDVLFALNDTLTLNYKFGWRDVAQRNTNDTDQGNRTGGGVCPAEHPKVAVPVYADWVEIPEGSGNWLEPGTAVVGAVAQLTEGQTSRYCALDGGGNGTFSDTYLYSVFTSTQTSHEITLTSDFDGPFNFTLGYVTMEGEEPNFYSGPDHGSAAQDYLYEDNLAQCEAALAGLWGSGGTLSGGTSQLFRDIDTDSDAMAHVGTGAYSYACAGAPGISAYGDTGDNSFSANLDGFGWAFFGSADYEMWGAYLNTEYVVNDLWTVFGGIRKDEDDKDRTQSMYAYVEGYQADGTLCSDAVSDDCFAVVRAGPHDSSIDNYAGRGDMNWDDITWNVGTEFRPNDDIMVYGRISTGYRAGGSYGYGTSQAPWQFEAEELTNYEVGLKGMFLDNALQLQASYFFQDFESHWMYASRLKTEAEIAIDPNSGPLTSEITPISGTEIHGIELEGAWRITDSLSVRGFYNYLDTSVGDYPSLYPFAVPGEAGGWIELPWVDGNGNAQSSWIFGSADPVELGGNQLANQPEHKGSLTLAYDVPIPAEMGTLELLTIVNHRSKKYVELGNFDAYAVPSYTRWDLRANWRLANSAWTVTAFAQNLLDEAAISMWSPREGTGSPYGTMVEPRQIGLSVSWQNQ